MLEQKPATLMFTRLCACASVPQPPAAAAVPAQQEVMPATNPLSTSPEAAALFDTALVLTDAGDDAVAAVK